MTKKERKKYNATYYKKNKKRLQKYRAMKYRTDAHYRDSVKKAAAERQHKLHKGGTNAKKGKQSKKGS